MVRVGMDRMKTFIVTLKELEKYGWTPREQLKKNPRLKKT